MTSPLRCLNTTQTNERPSSPRSPRTLNSKLRCRRPKVNPYTEEQQAGSDAHKVIIKVIKVNWPHPGNKSQAVICVCNLTALIVMAVFAAILEPKNGYYFFSQILVR